MNNQICNPEKEVPKTIEMNDRDYLNAILEQEKNMSNNLSIAIDEASNMEIFHEYYEIFNALKEAARDAYNLAFKNGWYKLEEENPNKVSQKLQELNQKFNELQK